jgi:FKBP-type peptidyl-prolyl cis-trans isomerase
MRRLATALLASAVAALAGCGSASAPADENDAVTATGPVGKAPVVRIPAHRAGTALVTRSLAAGHGPALLAGDSYLANFSVYVWHGTTHRLLYSTFSAMPQVLPVTIGLAGVQRAVTGLRSGGRVLAVVPPKYGYGSAGNSQIGVTPGDTLVWVVDPIRVFTRTASATGAHVSDGGGRLPRVTASPGTAPVIAVPKNAPPGSLKVVTLIKGGGPAIRSGEAVVVKYVGMIWRNQQVFDENWPSAARPTAIPTVFRLGQVIAGWNTGLVGIPVGSRVMLVIPPADGYGARGQPQAGIKGNDTLVFVVDILATAS